MKKGLVLTLVLMAMVAMVIPASARAPLIRDLPNVIIGDNGDSGSGGSGTVYLMRYLNAFNLANPSVIERQNGYADTKYQVFYSQPSAAVPQVKPSGAPGGSIIESLTTDEANDLINGVAAPPAAKNIVDGAAGYFWMSLLNTTINPTTTSAYDLVPADDGALRPYPANSADPGTATLTVYAVEADLPTTLVGVGSFYAVSISDANDGGTSPDILQYSADFEGNTDNWFFLPSGGTNIVNAAGAGTGTGLGITGRSDQPTGSNIAVWGTWYLSSDGTNADFLLPAQQSTLGTNIFQIRALMSSTAGSPANSPGFRLLYVNELFTHLGGLQALTFTFAGDGTDIIVPSTAGTKEARVYWAPPFGLSEMADGGLASNFGNGFTDIRNYNVMFDMVDVELADTGVLALENIDIYASPRPATKAAAYNWGAGQTAFNSASLGWAGSGANTYGLGVGTFTPGANSIVMTCGAGATGYCVASPDTALGGASGRAILWTSAQLNRYSVTVASAAANTAPTMRMLVTAYTDTYGLLSPFWADSFGPGLSKVFYAPGTAVGVAAPGGSTIEAYMWGHTAGSGTSTGYLFPSLDVYTAGAASGWSAESGNMTISSIKIEQNI